MYSVIKKSREIALDSYQKIYGDNFAYILAIVEISFLSNWCDVYDLKFQY